MFQFQKSFFLNPKENIRIEKKKLKQGHSQSVHTHEFVELVYMMEGNAIQYIDDLELTACKGDMFFINYNQKHSFTAVSNICYVDILLTPSFMSEELMDVQNIFEIFTISIFKEFVDCETTSEQKVSFDGSDACEIEQIIKDMLSEFTQKKTGYISVLSGYMRVLFSKLLRNLKNETDHSSQYVSNITPDIMEYIDHHCYEKISLSDIAQKCFYTPSYFSYAFKKYCGQSLSEYIKKKRITYAMELLEHTNDTISEISELVGYHDRAFFYKTFKEVVGKSPSEYRNCLK